MTVSPTFDRPDISDCIQYHYSSWVPGRIVQYLHEIDVDRQYIGFEPQLSGCSLIDQFIADNELKNHVIMPVGLSDKRGFVRLGSNRTNDVAASMIEEYRPDDFYSRYTVISVVSGDEALQSLDLSSLALIKIDVERGELEVLRGLESTISRFKPYIVFEVLPHMIVRTRTELDTTTKEVRDRRHDQIDELLRNTGYTIFRIETVSGIRETSKLQAASHQLFNYIAVPEAEVGSFQQAYSGPVADALPPNN